MWFDCEGNFVISKEELEQIFEKAIIRLWNHDKSLLSSGVQERALQFKLALYLRELFAFAEQGGLNIDVEYNRDGDDLQKRPDHSQPYNRQTNSWFAPDILLHQRGSRNEDYKNDVIICEVKKESEGEHFDAQKIKNQMSIRKYQYGIDLYKLKADCIEFDLYTLVDGSPIKAGDYKFNFSTLKLEGKCNG